MKDISIILHILLEQMKLRPCPARHLSSLLCTRRPQRIWILQTLTSKVNERNKSFTRSHLKWSQRCRRGGGHRCPITGRHWSGDAVREPKQTCRAPSLPRLRLRLWNWGSVSVVRWDENPLSPTFFVPIHNYFYYANVETVKRTNPFY